MKRILRFLALALFALLLTACAETDEPPAGPHTHTTVLREETGSTCEVAGHTAYWECTECGAYFYDSTARDAIVDKNSVLLPLLSHTLQWHFDEDSHWQEYACTCASPEGTDAPHVLGEHSICPTCDYQQGTEGLVYQEMIDYAWLTGIGTASGDVVVASLYRGLPVTRIGTMGSDKLTSIRIPSTVTYIDACTFQGCDALEAVIFTGTSQLQAIEMRTFSGCENLRSIQLPSSIKSIAYEAFFNCKSLSSICIPAATEVIGERAFSLCWNMTDVSVEKSSSLRSIEDRAFYYCTVLSSFTTPESLRKVAASAFEGCPALFQEENGIQYVDKWAIASDKYLETALLRADTLGIGAYTFEDRGIETITFPQTLVSIDSYAFCDSRLSEIVGGLPQKLAYIGERAFDGTALRGEDLYIPASVEYIGDYAFFLGFGFQSLTFAEGSRLTTIGSHAFRAALYHATTSTLTIPASVEYIGERAFEYANLTSIVFAAGSRLQEIADYAFANVPLTSFTVPASVTSIGREIFYQDDDELIIPITFENPYYWITDVSLGLETKTPEECGNLLCKTYALYKWKRLIY